MMDSDLKELCVVLLFLKFVENDTEEESLRRAFETIKKIRNWDFERSLYLNTVDD